jgi:hypothetical protein
VRQGHANRNGRARQQALRLRARLRESLTRVAATRAPQSVARSANLGLSRPESGGGEDNGTSLAEAPLRRTLRRNPPAMTGLPQERDSSVEVSPAIQFMLGGPVNGNST